MDTTEKTALCERMAASSRTDAEAFWPGGALYYFERIIAADIWDQAAARLPNGVAEADFLELAEELETAAEASRLAGLPAKATEEKIQAQTWRRIVRILNGEEPL